MITINSSIFDIAQEYIMNTSIFEYFDHEASLPDGDQQVLKSLWLMLSEEDRLHFEHQYPKSHFGYVWNSTKPLNPPEESFSKLLALLKNPKSGKRTYAWSCIKEMLPSLDSFADRLKLVRSLPDLPKTYREGIAKWARQKGSWFKEFAAPFAEAWIRHQEGPELAEAVIRYLDDAFIKEHFNELLVDMPHYDRLYRLLCIRLGHSPPIPY